MDHVRVLYSFPHKIGADRICTTAWQQVNGLAQAGVHVLACPGVFIRPMRLEVTVRPTLARGKIRIPYKALGSMRAFALHDYIVSRRLERMAGKIDIVHAWPLGSLRTLKTAARLGIPAVLERPNAHTRFAYEVVQNECNRLGVVLPSNHEHAYKAEVLAREVAESDLAFRLLCPSEFVASTFLERGFSNRRLARHQYGYNERDFYPDPERRREPKGLRMLFVGGCAPRKGLHYALEAWLKSTAAKNGKFLVAGQFVPGYAERLSHELAHPSVCVLGHRTDVGELMRKSDILVLPSIEEGSALVTFEARGSGCVLLVSDAAGAICVHQENALVHHVGDVQALAQHITTLNEHRDLLEKLRAASLDTVHEITWTAAGSRLLSIYRETIDMYFQSMSRRTSTVPMAV